MISDYYNWNTAHTSLPIAEEPILAFVPLHRLRHIASWTIALPSDLMCVHIISVTPVFYAAIRMGANDCVSFANGSFRTMPTKIFSCGLDQKTVTVCVVDFRRSTLLMVPDPSAFW